MSATTQPFESAESRALIRERDEALRDRDGVTICVPCYQQSEYLPDCLASIAAQTVPPLEVIVVDDGTPGDEAIEICHTCESAGYHYVRVTNRGLPSARNTGLMLAKGRAFLPLDADDTIRPDYIEKTLPLLDDHDVVLTGIQEVGVRNGTYAPGFDMDWRDVQEDHLWRMNRFYYCNTPEAPIWMGDFTFREAGSVVVGDQVIGWTVGSGNRRTCLTATTVTGTAIRRSPIVRVQMASGRFLRCSPDHLWLSWQQSPGNRSTGFARLDRWKGFKTAPYREGRDMFVCPEAGRALCHVIEPVDTALRATRVSGYLAGLYDGEGTNNTLSQSDERNPDVVVGIRNALTELGIPFTEHRHPGKCRQFHITGGRQAYVDFVNRVGPIRVRSIAPRILTAKFREKDKIVAVEPDGFGEVVSLETETGNYVAWGYASKNCALHRTEALRLVGGYNPQLRWGWEDYDVWIDYMRRGFRFNACPEPLFVYRTTNDGMMARCARDHREELMAEMRRHHLA